MSQCHQTQDGPGPCRGWLPWPHLIPWLPAVSIPGKGVAGLASRLAQEMLPSSWTLEWKDREPGPVASRESPTWPFAFWGHQIGTRLRGFLGVQDFGCCTLGQSWENWDDWSPRIPASRPSSGSGFSDFHKTLCQPWTHGPVVRQLGQLQLGIQMFSPWGKNDR